MDGYDLKNSFIDFKNENLNTLGLPDLAWWEPGRDSLNSGGRQRLYREILIASLP